MIKFIGEQDEYVGEVHLNDDNKVTIEVMTDNFDFDIVELYKITPPVKKKRGKAGGKRRLSRKKKSSRKRKSLRKRKSSRKRK